MNLIFTLVLFWIGHPALFYGIAFYLGLSAYQTDSIWLWIPCLSLWLPFAIGLFQKKELWKPFFLNFLIFCTAWVYAGTQCFSGTIPSSGVEGEAVLKIKSIRLNQTFFGEKWVYQCLMEPFTSAGYPIKGLPHSIPCQFSFQIDKPRPSADRDYLVRGKLIQTKEGVFRLKGIKSGWLPIAGSKSRAEKRYLWKTSVVSWIHKRIVNPLSAHFLAGLATGEFSDYWMKEQFSRFGLQHLLVISGFHFSMIAAFLHFAFRLCLPSKLQLPALLFCLAAYSFFLGPQASILRSWIMCSFGICGILFEKKTSSLNLLGVALLIILAYDPSFSKELGFALSFAATAAILLFYPIALSWLSMLLIKMPFSDVLKMNWWSQLGYCLVNYLRKGISLTLAVNIFALPMTLFYFHQYPWMSLLFNLFFPLLASGSLFLLLLGSLLTWIPLAGAAIHDLNSRYTHFILQLTYQVPYEVDSYLLMESFPVGFLLIYFSCSIILGILHQPKSPAQDFNFI